MNRAFIAAVAALAIPACERAGGRAPAPNAGAGPGAAQPLNPYEGDRTALADGKRLYNWMNCSGCHFNGGGGIGPPLMDDEWIYGERPSQIFETIAQGRPNGMPAYGGRLPDDQIWKIVAYVRTLSDLDPGLPEGASSGPLQDKASGNQ